MNIDKLSRIHFIGITSSFSSFCASVLLEQGKRITASQHKYQKEEVENWLKLGVLYPEGHDEKYITPDMDLVVIPNGPLPNNPEIIKAKNLKIKTITISKLTGLLLKKYKVIAVAGTHGKTTTCALITWIFYANGIEPNYIFGGTEGKLKHVDKNWNFNPKCDYAIIEACEYKKQFLERVPNPFISVITHIDLDHTDYFKNQKNYNEAFVEFLENTAGSIIIDKTGKNEKYVLRNLKKRCEVVNVAKLNTEFRSSLFGKHNQENMKRAYLTAKNIGFTDKQILKAFKTFPGLSERAEFVKKFSKNSLLYKDYAHNPPKIKACLQAFRSEFPKKQLVIIFEPHSYERLYTFSKEFIDSLSLADHVFVTDIFSPARESDNYRNLISTQTFVEMFNRVNKEKAQHLKEVNLNSLGKLANAVVVIASAGKILKSV